MQITDVTVKLVARSDNKLRGIASIVIDNDFVVHDIKIIEGSNGCFIVMPSRKTPDGKYRDVAHPLRTEVRDYIGAKVLEAYNDALQNE